MQRPEVSQQTHQRHEQVYPQHNTPLTALHLQAIKSFYPPKLLTLLHHRGSTTATHFSKVNSGGNTAANTACQSCHDQGNKQDEPCPSKLTNVAHPPEQQPDQNGKNNVGEECAHVCTSECHDNQSKHCETDVNVERKEIPPGLVHIILGANFAVVASEHLFTPRNILFSTQVKSSFFVTSSSIFYFAITG